MRKGSAVIVVLICVLILTIAGSALFILGLSNKKPPTDEADRTLDLNSQTVKETVPQSTALQALTTKMKSYANYQLFLNRKTSKTEINWQFLRVGEKMSNSDDKTPTVISYSDRSKNKTYSYDKTSNKYLEDKETGFKLSTSEYYFEQWTDAAKVGEEQIDGMSTIVYENTNGDIKRTAYISAETGLPIKIIQKSPQSETTFNFRWSRVNEVQESEVTLPANAQRFSEEEMEAGDKLLDLITNP